MNTWKDIYNLIITYTTNNGKHNFLNIYYLKFKTEYKSKLEATLKNKYNNMKWVVLLFQMTIITYKYD